jgi:uncharacterized protein (DUF58 family)
MLYPDFKDLISYESSSQLLGYHIKNKSLSQFAGNYTSSFKGQGMEFDEVRNYAEGDDVRSVDWRVTARLDEMFVKVFKQEKQRNVLICVDKNSYMNFGTRITFKNIIAAKAAAIIGFAANKNADKVGFYVFGDVKDRFSYLKPNLSKGSILKGLKLLCNEGDGQENYAIDGAIFNLKRLDVSPSIIFIISDFRGINEVFEKNLYLIAKKAEVVFINISDESDYFIPDVGRIILKQGTRRYLLNTSYRQGIKNYQRNFQERQRYLNKIKTKLRARLIEISTKDDPLKTLITGIKRK